MPIILRDDRSIELTRSSTRRLAAGENSKKGILCHYTGCTWQSGPMNLPVLICSGPDFWTRGEMQVQYFSTNRPTLDRLGTVGLAGVWVSRMVGMSCRRPRGQFGKGRSLSSYFPMIAIWGLGVVAGDDSSVRVWSTILDCVQLRSEWSHFSTMRGPQPVSKQ